MFDALFLKLKTLGIEIEPATLKKHSVQGFMSSVYTISSSAGELVLHMLTPKAEQARQRTWEKAAGLYTLLEQQGIPSARVLAVEEEDGVYTSAQEKLPGTSAGVRVRKGMTIVDQWAVPRNLFSDIEKMLAKLHSTHVAGYGWIVADAGSIRGAYKTWEAFLENEINFWLATIRPLDPDITERAERYFFPLSKHPQFTGPASLVHNDMTNPSNILVNEGKITGIVDWEWALAGDPAMEFEFNNQYPLDDYFAARGIKSSEERADFRRRIEFYKPLFLLWGLCVHADDPGGALYQTLRFNLEKTLGQVSRV